MGRIFFVKIISIYQFLKILFQISPSCRFTPTCSEYTKEAVRRYGILKGIVLGTKRVLSCHQFNKGGYDPVP